MSIEVKCGTPEACATCPFNEAGANPEIAHHLGQIASIFTEEHGEPTGTAIMRASELVDPTLTQDVSSRLITATRTASSRVGTIYCS